MKEYFKVTYNEISAFLKAFLHSAEPRYGAVNGYGPDSLRRVLDFTLKGKMLRGGMVRLGMEVFGGTAFENAIAAGGAMELFQSAFLVHDDVMDRDFLRRGAPSVFAQYKEMGDDLGFGESLHFGNSLAICTGDICFFLGFLVMSGLSASPALLQKINAFVADEYIKVGLAQMQDVTFGYIHGAVEKEEVERVYLYKTARYTFSLPLMLGALLAGREGDEAQKLGGIGELLGLVFQIKDDELGLFGSESDLGKPIGSDFREGKKTLVVLEHLSRLTEDEAAAFLALYGNPDATEAEITRATQAIEASGAREAMNLQAQSYAEEAKSLIESLPETAARNVLTKLTDYNLTRVK